MTFLVINKNKTVVTNVNIIQSMFQENSSLHISCTKSLNDPFYPQKFLFVHPNFRMTFFYYCTNSLSSLHISNYHCTFCASLHVKTSPGRKIPKKDKYNHV